MSCEEDAHIVLPDPADPQIAVCEQCGHRYAFTEADLQPVLSGRPRWQVDNAVRISRLAQGLPPRVTDPAALQRVAILLKANQRERRS